MRRAGHTPAASWTRLRTRRERERLSDWAWRLPFVCGQIGMPLLDSSGDFLEMAEAEGLDHLGLQGRDVFVGFVGAKRCADDGTDGAAALGLTDELDDGLRDIVW